MFRWVLSLVILLTMWAIPLSAAQLTVYAKGKKGTPQNYTGEVVDFDGVTLTFGVSGEQIPRKFSAASVYIEIVIRTLPKSTQGDHQSPVKPGEPVFYPGKGDNTQSTILPGRLSNSNDADHIKNPDLVIYEGQLKEKTDKNQVAATVDLTSCRDRGRDWLMTSTGFKRAIVIGRITKIHDGIVIFQKAPETPKSPEIQQKFLLSQDLSSIIIGSCL